MLKINKSILIICMISLFLIIGQISASDTDLIKINDSDTSNYSTELIDMDSNYFKEYQKKHPELKVEDYN